MAIARRIALPPRRRRQAGMALVFALFGMGALLLAGASAMLAGSGNVIATRNYRGAAQVHFVAESGLSRGLQAVNAVGVVNFQNEVVNQWAGFVGDGTQPFAALDGFTYTVTALVDPTDAANRGRLRAIARGAEGTQNTVVATLVRSNVPSTSPGAIYLATDAASDADFVGNAFLVDGNDHLLGGGMGPGAPVPGIATRNATNTNETIASLNAGQKDNVIGQGFSLSPLTPSVMTAPSAPSVAQLQQIVADLLAQPGVHTVSSNKINGGDTFGTNSSGQCVAPQITHFTATDGVTMKGTGNASGCGILVVDSNLTIQGNFDFIGLVIVGGATTVQPDWETGMLGNAAVWGSLWTSELNLKVGGSAQALYSSQGLAFANNTIVTGALPAPMQVVSLVDCAQVSPGLSGCP